MSLRITLKPGEKLILGAVEVINGSTPADFRIECEDVPILRGREILTEDKVDTPCTRLYYNIQNIYIKGITDAARQNELLHDATAILRCAPSLKFYLNDTMSLFVIGEYYKSLQSCKRLIDEESAILGKKTCDSAPKNLN